MTAPTEPKYPSTTTGSPGSPTAMPANRGPRSNSRPKQNFETWSWFFMRVSGLVLVFLALSHFAITHIINDVVETDAEFVAARWDNPLWRLFDWTLLFLALFHGLNGIRTVIDDYVIHPGKRAATKAAIYGTSLVLFVYGTFTIVTFSGIH